MNILIYGLITGFLFGFLLQKGRVLRYDKQLGALRLMDMTIVKFMLSSVIVGMVGVYLLQDLGVAKLSVKPLMLGPIIIGGLLFGLGWGLLGYCPGTSMGALGEGRWDALWGILGMIVGGGLFAEAYPWLRSTVYNWGDYGRLTLPEMLGVNHWLIIPVFIVGAILLFRWFERKGL
ncbi:YeeE/YedE thiosulfate transporter family protein [Desulfonatronum lacustre]|uniref:YeeE/YedE thiosulfate transporter family protein n=1 Tax=Desulfonatronum lacustre TaxID=66849 RepID=UPI00048D250F|nr:YeeE/YedE thiosulfate transporter family protein [Desulfonatronum lacustre]